MPKVRLLVAFLLFTLSHLIPTNCNAQSWYTEEKITSKYAKVFYENEDTLRLFNKRLRLSFSSYLLKRTTGGDLSLQGQVTEKIDFIVGRVKVILEMHPRNFKADIKIVPNSDNIKALYRKKYYREVDFIAFYSPQEKAIYVSADDLNPNVLAHEIAHAVIDQYFGVAAPVKIHEILAQYVDEHFEE